MAAVILLAVALTAGVLSACGGDIASSSISAWTPAAKLTSGPEAFDWAAPTQVSGKLLPNVWTASASFKLPAGPATVVGVVRVQGSTTPSFTARLLPVRSPPSFPGYRLTNVSLWHLPMIRQGEGAIADWFPFALPSGTYRLLVREASGGGSGGVYELYVAGVK